MKRVAKTLGSAAILLLLAALPAFADGQKLLHSERSLYREVLVYESAGQRCMCFTRNCRIGRQSCMDMRHPLYGDRKSVV